MALILNEEQNLLKTSAKDFFSSKMPVSQLRKLRDAKDPVGYSNDSWKEIVELGWSGIIVEEEFGGLQFGYTGLGVVMEEAGRTLAASPLFATCVLGASAISIAGSQEQKSSLLPQIVQGSLTLALAIEESSTHGPQRTRTTASKSGTGYTLNGEKTFVLDGHSADKLIIVARTSGKPGDNTGLTLFLVDRNSTGISVKRHFMADGRNAAYITFSNVAVPASALLGGVDQAGQALQDILGVGQILLSAEMLGSLQEAFERTINYIKTRVQFDRHIGSLQAIQHRAAHMYAEIELAKSVVIAALSALDEGVRGADLAKQASLTKAKLAEVFLLISSEGVQMHGGIGMTDDEEIGFFLKRARTAEHTLGDIRYHQNRYGDLLAI